MIQERTDIQGELFCYHAWSEITKRGMQGRGPHRAADEVRRDTRHALAKALWSNRAEFRKVKNRKTQEEARREWLKREEQRLTREQAEAERAKRQAAAVKAAEARKLEFAGLVAAAPNSRADAAALASFLMEHPWKDSGDAHHFGKQELRILFDAIYGSPPKDKSEEIA